MGKLIEALRRRQKALEDHKRAPHQPYEKNPAEGYRYTERLIELNYLNEKAASLLSVALKRLTPQQRKQFFDQSLNDKAKQYFSYRGYQAIMTKAYNAGKQIEALTNTFNSFAGSGVFGRPLEQVLSSLEKLVSPRSLEKARKGQGPNASAAEKMARLYSEMEEKEKDKIHELMSPAGKQAICDLTMERYVQEDRIGPILRNDKNCREGSTWMENFGVLEQLLGEQAVDEIAGQIDGLIPPKQSPDKTVRPRQADIDKLRADIRPEDPEAAEKQGLLDRAAEYLVYPSAEYLKYLDTYDAKSVAGADGLGTGNSALGYYTIQQGIEGLADGKFKGRIPGQKSNYTNYINYAPTNVEPLHRGNYTVSGVDLTEEELEELRKAGQAGIEPKTSQAIQEVISGIEALGEKNYQIPQAALLIEGSWDNPVKLEYMAEQGNKKYAFWPLVNAKNAMDRAVQTGDWAEIQKTVAEYERCKAITDKMMRTVNELSKEPCYPGNVNSTRPEMAEPYCPMPTEYLEDFPGHSRVNGIYQLYAMSKNTGYPVSRILQDPAGIMNELAQDYLRDRLLSAQRGKPLGARLAMGFNGTLCQQAQTGWSNTMGPISRGLDAVVGLMPDAQQRQACAVRNFCALAVANYEVRKELTPWITLSNNNAEKMTAAARMALLTPENEFDLADVGLKLGKDDWPKTLDPDGLTDRLQKEGRLTPAQLIAKSKQLIAEAAEAEKGMAKRFKPTHDSLYPIRQAAIQTCERFLRNASPAQREEQGYQDLAAHVTSLRNDLFKADYSLQNERLKDWTTRYKQNLNVLKQDKRGWFLSSKNSEEYDQMIRPMRRLNAKLDLLSGNVQNLNEDTRIKGEGLDIKNLMDEARQKAYAYACKKTDSGTGQILHEAGSKRFWAAFDNCCVIGEMADQLGIRSPAERIVDNVQLSALKNRNTGGWEREQCEKHAARSLLAQSIRHTTVSWEEQERLLQPKEMDKAIEKIRKTDAFRQMVNKEGLSGLADIILQGADALTTAYRNALQQKNGPQAAADPSRLTREQTAEFWRGAEAPDKAPAPAAQQQGLQ